MTVIITMAGMGKRFANEGYLVPKYRIIARGQTLFYWSIISLVNFFNEHFIFCCLDNEDIDWVRINAKKLGIKKMSFHLRSSISSGQAETAYDSIYMADPMDKLWIYNIDTYIANGILKPNDIGNYSGCIPVAYSNENNMSFVKYDAQGFVAEVAEKRQISSWASIGLYGFESAETFKLTFEKAYCQNQIQKINNELYITPMYEVLLQENKKICAPQIAIDNVHILGTPAQLKFFDPLTKAPFGV